MAQIGKIVSSHELQIQHSVEVQKEVGNSEFAKELNLRGKNALQVQFSRHASQRMKQRGITLSVESLKKLDQAVNTAREKGSKDTVIISRQGVFIVNVPNNIVVTTIAEQDMKNNIFTNIDSAVFM